MPTLCAPPPCQRLEALLVRFVRALTNCDKIVCYTYTILTIFCRLKFSLIQSIICRIIYTGPNWEQCLMNANISRDLSRFPSSVIAKLLHFHMNETSVRAWMMEVHGSVTLPWPPQRVCVAAMSHGGPHVAWCRCCFNRRHHPTQPWQARGPLA